MNEKFQAKIKYLNCAVNPDSMLLFNKHVLLHILGSLKFFVHFQFGGELSLGIVHILKFGLWIVFLTVNR